MTAASLRSGDIVNMHGEDICLGRVRRVYARRGTGLYHFDVDIEILPSRKHVLLNSSTSVMLVERNRVKDRYG